MLAWLVGLMVLLMEAQVPPTSTAPATPAPKPPSAAPTAATQATTAQSGMPQPATAPSGATPATLPAAMMGPMRLEVAAIREDRIKFVDPQPQQRKPQLGMQFRLAGERLPQIVRVSNVIVNEMLDDQGKSLIGPETFAPEYLTQTRQVNITPESQTGLLLTMVVDASSRAAKAIGKLRGHVRVFFASGTETIVIENAALQRGKVLDHPRLMALGVQIRVLPVEEPPSPTPVAADRAVALQFVQGEDKISRIEFFDGWMRRMAIRPVPAKTSAGDNCTSYRFAGEAFNEDSDMIITVYSDLEEVKVPLSVDSFELP